MKEAPKIKRFQLIFQNEIHSVGVSTFLTLRKGLLDVIGPIPQSLLISTIM